MSKCGKITLGVVITTWITAVWAYRVMPEIMVTHWGMYGEPNGYSPKIFGVFFLPALTVALWGILKIVPRMDPLAKNIGKFAAAYEQFICGIVGFMAFIYVISLAWNLGIKFDFLRVLAVGMGVVYVMTGRLLAKTEPNWSIGVRTPWTIANPTVWRKTNDVAGKLFAVCGGLALLGLMWPKIGMVVMIVPIIAVSIGVYIYSYWLFRKLKKG
jgi:uncharacterized membrane protein